MTSSHAQKCLRFRVGLTFESISSLNFKIKPITPEFFEINLILFIEIDLVNTIIDEIDIINSKEKTWLD